VAADEAADFVLLTRAARRSIDDLRGALERAPRRPGERGSHYLDVLRATLDAFDAAVSSRVTAFSSAKDAGDKRAIVVAMREIAAEILKRHRLAPDIQNAAEPPLGLGFIYFLDELVARLFKEKADVVMLPGLNYNYSTGFRPFEDDLKALGVTTYAAPVPPVVVRYPVLEAESLFLHLMFAHEFGHHVIDQSRLDEDVLNGDPNPADNLASANAAIVAYRNFHQNKVSEARARGVVVQSLVSWINELICDGIAFGVLGASYLLSFGAISPPFGGPEPGATHPPFPIRARFLIRLVDDWDWRPLLESRIPKTFAWLEQTAKRLQETGKMTYFLYLEEIVDRLGETIRDVIDARLGPQRYTRDEYEQQADQLLALLEHNVLPAQLDDQSPADRRAILLAGWLNAFAKHKDDPAAFIDLVADTGYQRFLTKALEMSIVLEQWKKL
jgi:hypothetical protein